MLPRKVGKLAKYCQMQCAGKNWVLFDPDVYMYATETGPLQIIGT